jgi:hypothetical protein
MKKLFGRGKAMPGTAAVEAASAVEVGYEKLFFRKCDTKTRSGKVVYIRKEHHDRILKIVRVIGENEFSLFNYLDNVLENHFSTYQDEITELYRKKNTDVFN